MSIELDIQTLLGALVSGRCYPMVAPDNVVKPYITFQIIANSPVTALDGSTGTINKRLQVNVWATTYGVAKTLSESVSAAMEGATFTSVSLPSAGDQYESETQLYGEISEFSIWTQT